MHLNPILHFLCILPFWGLVASANEMTIDLSGRWHMALDGEEEGEVMRWFEGLPGGEYMRLPGSLEENRIGDPITIETAWVGSIVDRSWFTEEAYAPYREPGAIKVPFWLQPETHYVGAAWFQREVEIPVEWAGQRVLLSLERPHWKTTVWMDGRMLGSNDSLSIAHEYELGVDLALGTHTLVIRVDNTIDPDIGINSHSISDHTQGNWNGIVGRMELRATPPVWIESIQILTELESSKLQVRGTLRNRTSSLIDTTLELSVDGATGTHQFRFKGVASHLPIELELPIGSDLEHWDEFSPITHELELKLLAEASDRKYEQDQTIVFGLRDIGVEGKHLQINGRNLFLRGTLDCAAFPHTGYPPMDVESWRRIFSVIQKHGLNHIRFHSWCPPEAAFVAADAMGLYLQVEVASWPSTSTSLGDGKPVEAWIDRESFRIQQRYGNHPSFVILSAGNEPAGNSEKWLSGWVQRQKASDTRRLYVCSAGWPVIEANDFQLTMKPRLQVWGAGLDSRINRFPPDTRFDFTDTVGRFRQPVVSHEIGQWCAYPNFSEMSKYTGHLKPRNLEIFKESLIANHMIDLADDFLIASGKLQAVCYKEEIESALRTPSMGGFQLLGLSDFPGQGTALVGVLDVFWEEKGYITPSEFRRFCNTTVPLARLDKRVFTVDEHLVADVEVAHFGPAPIENVDAHWQLVDTAGCVVAEGEFARRDLPIGGGRLLGHIDLSLSELPAPARYRLVVELDRTDFANDWDIWIYPSAQEVVKPIPDDVLVVHSYNEWVEDQLASGTRVWLQIPSKQVAPDAEGGEIALGFSSIFWNTAWTEGQAPHTLGILCDPENLALSGFPTEFHSNWQWWYVMTNAAPMILDNFPRQLNPTIQVIDDWFTNRKLGLVFEARVGGGRLLVSSIDFGGSTLDPVRRQLHASLLEYIASDRFQPEIEISSQSLTNLLRK